MQFIKEKFSDQARYFELFFLAIKLSCIFSAFFLIKMAVEMIRFDLGLENVTILGLTFGGLFFLSLQVTATIFAEKFINKNNILGLIISYFLILICLCSILFPIGLFGFYAFFNQEFRNRYFVDQRPLWLENIYAQIEKWTSPKKV